MDRSTISVAVIAISALITTLIFTYNLGKQAGREGIDRAHESAMNAHQLTAEYQSMVIECLDSR